MTEIMNRRKFLLCATAAAATPVIIPGTVRGESEITTIPPPIFTPKRIPVTGPEWKGKKDTFSFVILGDKTSGGEKNWPIFDRAVSEINLLAPDFVITTGDQIPGHMEKREVWDSEWKTYMDHADTLQCPLVLVAGNHDIANTQCYNFWQEDFGATYYFFLYRQCLFLVLNTEEERFDGRGPVWEKMMGFAESSLKEYTEVQHTFVFFHKPMWVDPRFKQDWKRLRTALGTRRFTVIAGHEHYLSVDYDEENPLIIMNATGAGVRESNIRAFGGFHAYAHVTVQEKNTQIKIMEPGGKIWPLDCAPASFRAAIDHDVVRLDAAMPSELKTGKTQINAFAALNNCFDKAITVRLSIAPIKKCGWGFPAHQDISYDTTSDAATLEIRLIPKQKENVPLAFDVPVNAIPTPPAITWAIRYDGEWIDKEPMRMEEVNAVPLYPASAWRDIPTWQVVGAFPIGKIDTRYLPHDPTQANPKLFKEFGPEQGYKKGASYGKNLTWQPAQSCGKGLLNHNAILGTTDLAVAYNSVSICTTERLYTHVLLYADNFAQLYLNGDLQESAQAFGAPGGFVYVPVTLEKGWNKMVVKIINNRGDWFLRCLIADPKNILIFSDIPPHSELNS